MRIRLLRRIDERYYHGDIEAMRIKALATTRVRISALPPPDQMGLASRQYSPDEVSMQ